MAREKELFRDNLERLDNKFPDKELLTVQDVRKFCKISEEKAKVMFPMQKQGGRYYISKVKLANLLS